MKLKLGRKGKGAARTKTSGGLKMMLLTHGEKILLAIIGPCVLWLVYSALGTESLEDSRQPDDLSQLAQLATRSIDALTYSDLPTEKRPALRDFSEVSVSPTLSVDDYLAPVPLNPPEFPRRTKRGDPALLSIEEVEITAGFGLFAMLDPAGGGRGPLDPGIRVQTKDDERRRDDDARDRRGRQRDAQGRGNEDNGRRRAPRGDKETEDVVGGVRPGPGGDFARAAVPQGVPVGTNAKVEGRFYAIVLAKVPFLKQLREYERVFRSAQLFQQTDIPQYLGYVVERAEISREGEADWKRLTTISVNTGFDAITKTWSVTAPEVVDQEYVDELFTFPLPPLVGRPWDASATHSSVPMASFGRGPFAPGGEEELGPLEEDGKGEPGDLPFGTIDRAPGRVPRVLGGGGGPREERGLPPRRGGWPGDDKMEMPPEEGRGPVGGWRRAEEEVAFALFRYFDFSVEPGKRYRYRVRLALRDPNDNLPAMYLDDEVIRRREQLSEKGRIFRLSDWSEPSPTVVVPFPGRLLAGEVNAPRSELHYDEPKATVLAKMFDRARGVEAATEIKKMGLGAVGNFTESVQVQVHGGAENNTMKTISDFAFKTNTTLVDIRGGEGLSPKDRDLTAPGELLLLDGAGRLVVRGELADAEELSQYRATAVDANAQRRGGTDARDEESEVTAPRGRRARGGDR
jgi:hypothetical protein